MPVNLPNSCKPLQNLHAFLQNSRTLDMMVHRVRNLRTLDMMVHGVRRDGSASGPWAGGGVTIARVVASVDYSRPIHPRWTATAGLHLQVRATAGLNLQVRATAGLNLQRAGARDDHSHPKLGDAYGSPLTFRYSLHNPHPFSPPLLPPQWPGVRRNAHNKAGDCFLTRIPYSPPPRPPPYPHLPIQSSLPPPSGRASDDMLIAKMETVYTDSGDNASSQVRLLIGTPPHGYASSQVRLLTGTPPPHRYASSQVRILQVRLLAGTPPHLYASSQVRLLADTLPRRYASSQIRLLPCTHVRSRPSPSPACPHPSPSSSPPVASHFLLPSRCFSLPPPLPSLLTPSSPSVASHSLLPSRHFSLPPPLPSLLTPSSPPIASHPSQLVLSYPNFPRLVSLPFKLPPNSPPPPFLISC
ncbi:unnamed protein product [Closterium sp. NIES-53]